MDCNDVKEIIKEHGVKVVKFAKENKKSLAALVAIVFASAIGASVGSRIKRN